VDAERRHARDTISLIVSLHSPPREARNFFFRTTPLPPSVMDALSELVNFLSGALICLGERSPPYEIFACDLIRTLPRFLFPLEVSFFSPSKMQPLGGPALQPVLPSRRSFFNVSRISEAPSPGEKMRSPLLPLLVLYLNSPQFPPPRQFPKHSVFFFTAPLLGGTNSFHPGQISWFPLATLLHVLLFRKLPLSTFSC